MQQEKGGKIMKLLISCGGTGGHFYPGLTLARSFNEAGHDVTIILSGQHTEKFSKSANEAGLRCRIQTKFRRAQKWYKKPLLAAYVILDFWRSYKNLKELKPDAVLIMGSFASFGVALAAKLLKVRLFIHEGNAVLGDCNRKFVNSAEQLFLSFPLRDYQISNSELSGFPVRQELVDSASNLNSSETNKTLLVFGGSQGSETLNTRLVKALNEVRPKLSILHISGSKKEKECLEELYQLENVKVVEFVDDMATCYQNSDLAIVRAGASTLYECALFKVPILAVPLPWAADDHQMANALAVNSLAGKEVIGICQQTEISTTEIDEFITNYKGLDVELFHQVLPSKGVADKIVVSICEQLQKKN